MRISDWSSDVSSSDLPNDGGGVHHPAFCGQQSRSRSFSSGRLPTSRWQQSASCCEVTVSMRSTNCLKRPDILYLHHFDERGNILVDPARQSIFRLIWNRPSSGPGRTEPPIAAAKNS